MATQVASKGTGGGRRWRLSTAGRFTLADAASDQVAELPTRRACAIIAFLCSHPGQRFTRERIATLLWGDRGEAQARASLRQALLEIRHATETGPPILKSDRTHLWAEPTSLEPEALDQTSWAHSDELLFDDLNGISPDFDEWLAITRADRGKRLADALRREVEKLLDKGRGAAALPLVDRLHRLDPFDEDSLRLALRAEYQAGRVAGIERRVREMDSRLQDELGVTVSSESRALRDELLEALSSSTTTTRPKLPPSVERPPKSKEDSVAAASAAEPKQRVRFWGANRIWAAAAIGTSLALGAVVLLDSRTDRTAASSAPSVALLPFTADSSDAEARKLATATRDAAAHTLSQGAFLIIDAAPQGGRAPADFIITGQASGTPDKVVTTVRLEETAHHVVVFSHQFEASREKAWDLPERVGAQLALRLSWIAPLFALERRHPGDPAITASLLQSISSGLDSVSDLQAYQESRRLVAKAPDSPLAQYNLAFMTPWVLGELPSEDRAGTVAAARRAADRTLKLAPEFGGAYLPWCLLHSEQRRVQCEDWLRVGVRADPDFPLNSWFLSRLLHDVGRLREAAELARLSFAHDTYMPQKIGLMLRMLEVTGQPAEAEQIYRRSTHWFPGNYYIISYRAGGMLLRGDVMAAQRFQVEAARQFEHEIVDGGAFQTHHPVAGLAPAVQSNSASGARSACAHVAPEDDGALQCMLGLARVGDLDGAYRYAYGMYLPRRGRTPADEERIWLDQPGASATAYLTGPAAAPMRRDPRYVALAERVGLLEYWRSGRPPDFCREKPEPICAQLLKRS